MKKEQAINILEKHKSKFEYGEVMNEAEFREIFNVVVTSNNEFTALAKHLTKEQIKKQISDEILLELSVSGIVKDILHSQGKHLIKQGNIYRVALPSENELIASKYRSKASRAILKARKLTENTPKLVDGTTSTAKSANYLLGG